MFSLILPLFRDPSVNIMAEAILSCANETLQTGEAELYGCFMRLFKCEPVSATMLTHMQGHLEVVVNKSSHHALLLNFLKGNSSASVRQNFIVQSNDNAYYSHRLWRVEGFQLDKRLTQFVSLVCVKQNKDLLYAEIARSSFYGIKQGYCVELFERMEPHLITSSLKRAIANLLLINACDMKSVGFYDKSHEMIRRFSKVIRNLLSAAGNEKDLALFEKCFDSAECWEWFKQYPDSPHWYYVYEFLVNNDLPGEQRLHFYKKLCDAGLACHVYRLESFSVRGGGKEKTWIKLTKRLLEIMPPKTYPEATLEIAAALTSSVNDTSIEYLRFIQERPSLKFKFRLGRTLVLCNEEGELIAIKIQKKGEVREILFKEFAFAEYLTSQKERELIHSDIPTAIGKSEASKIELFRWLQAESLEDRVALENMIEAGDTVSIYIYKAPPSYFVYLHQTDLSPAEFQLANENAIHDLANLLKTKGIVFPQLADIFHTIPGDLQERTDRGRYLVLTPLIRRFHEVENSGRVDKWQEAVRYVNLRASGIADLGDCLSFHEYSALSIFQEITQPFAGYSIDLRAKDKIFANIIAEYLFVFTLVCGVRGRQLTEQNPDITDPVNTIWLSLAIQMLENAINMILVFTEKPKDEVTSYVRSAVSVDLLARQMYFWMASDYWNHLDVPSLQKIYGDKVFFLEDKYILHEVKQGLGFSHDGIHQDLGAFNCQNPMQEDNKLYYFTAFFILHDCYLTGKSPISSPAAASVAAQGIFASSAMSLKGAGSTSVAGIPWGCWGY